MFGRIGPWEIGLILVIILIIFGVGKLPQVGSALGKGIRSFKKASSGEDEEEEIEKEVAKPKRATRKRTVKKAVKS
jgi:sec-independent protein translocase protein TatA